MILAHLNATGTMAMWHAAEYAFGFDLRPDQFALRVTKSGIEVRVKKPALVATPAVSKLTCKVLEGAACWSTKKRPSSSCTKQQPGVKAVPRITLVYR